jgi:DNA-binding NtrC family response regulator
VTVQATSADDQLPLHATMVGRSFAFRAATELIERFAACAAPVLILGETGTGKELAARAVHYCSPRRDAPFVPVNCGSLPDTLVESELFGHARGAFTDASRARRGLVQQAHGGTLFLDEVEALTPRAQVTLLRFVQDVSFRAVGDDEVQRSNARIVAASNVDLGQLVASKGFRADLLFRLEALAVVLPPLRERHGDINLLAPHLLIKAARSTGCSPKRLTAQALALLQVHRWPGNVRELENALLRVHLLCAGPCVDAADLLASVPALKYCSSTPSAAPLLRSLLREKKQSAVDEVERRFVEDILVRTGGNISAAARLCNMQRASLSKLAKKHAISVQTAETVLAR